MDRAQPASQETGLLIEALRTALGADGVVTDAAACALAGSDLLPDENDVVPTCVVRPASTADVAAAMRVLAAFDTAVVPRGAGLSYTGGVVPPVASVVVDTCRLDAVTIVPDDLYAIVGAGCTWEKLSLALKPYGLRPAPAPPISGSHSTVGGAASQGIGGAEGFVGLTIVLADGEIVRTGTWTTPGAMPFARHYGPDLTGLFVGDCGAFGVKTEIVVRLRPSEQKQFASFGFVRGADVVATMVALQRGVGGTALAFDRNRAEDATAGVSVGDAVRTAAAVAGKAGSVGQALRDVTRLALSKSSLAEPEWSLHLTAAGATAAIAAAQLDAMRLPCVAAGGTEIPPAVPQALDARPFSVRGMVGPAGERWVPVHGHLPLSAAGPCLTAVAACLARHEAAARAHGVRVNWLLASGGAQITMEPMFYWRDALDPLHMAYLSDRNRARFGGAARNPQARAFVRALRVAVRDVMDQHGATHNQIGRFYVPPSGDTLKRIKRALDPHRRMNPGVLGL